MAHGSKKWIRDYSGRLKRSTDRTRKDWKGDLHDWEYNHTAQYGLNNGVPCPQCKGIGKDIRNHRKLIEKIRNEEGSPRQHEAYEDFLRGEKTWAKNYNWFDGRYFDYSGFWKAFWEEKKIDIYWSRYVDIETMLCHKCRFKHETERAMWRNWTGHGSPGWYGRMLNQQYRAKVKNKMARAKFDEDLYDSIPDPKSTIQYW
jgi:hypothetical protein